jgi:XRE family transcriptional regulator, fatty acid utilization regulator
MFTENESVRLILGLKVKTLRQQKNLSYHQLADATGLSLSYLHDIETGKKYPKADKILALSKAFGVEYDYLVSLRSSKKLQPIIDLINSDFLNAVPWEHFGLSPAILLEMFANTPDKVTAFISTLLKISRSYQMSKESFYNAALRSYQDLYDNYFEDLENAVKDCRKQFKGKEQLPVSLEWIENTLSKQYAITVNRKKMGAIEDLQKIRSFYSKKQKILFINKKLSDAQEKFILGRELAFQFLQLQERPYESMIQKSNSFDELLNNFKASYFAVALLVPEEELVDDLKKLINLRNWDEKAWLQTISKYDATPEMFMQRLTNILPRHFGIESLFFLRMSGNISKDRFEMTKEIHLSQVHNPYANELQEHYCRRWVSINIMKEARTLEGKKKFRHPIILAQISEYWQTHNRYFCISVAKPRAKEDEPFVSVTIGILMDHKLTQRFQFLNDPTISKKIVNTTCERCSIPNCEVRAVPPLAFMKQEQLFRTERALSKLDE